MDYLRIMANERNYKEHDLCLKEQFINGINDEMINTEIVKELTTIRKTRDITNKQILSWAKEWKHRESRK